MRSGLGKRRLVARLLGPAAALLALGSLAVLPPSAGAVIVRTPNGAFSYMPNAPEAHARALQSVGFANMTYHGGPIMHSNTTHVIFWEASGHAFTSSYKALVAKYLGDVQADSLRASNVYSLDPQYVDSSGPAAYVSAFGRSLDDTNSYPTTGNCTAKPGTFDVCLTDAQLQTELNADIAANGLPTGLSDVYFILLPQNVNLCTSTTNNFCFAGSVSKDFCAYHFFDSAGGTTLYAAQPFAPQQPGCNPNQFPNGDPADVTLNVLSHEHNEAITDPVPPTGYFDTNTDGENGDKCDFNFGAAIGGSAGSLFTQAINGDHYTLQQEWSNAAGGCRQRVNMAAGFAPLTAVAGQAATFDTSPTHDTDGALSASSFAWNFGDGSPGASGANPSHTYVVGTYTVTLVVTDSSGFTDYTRQTVAAFRIKRIKLNRRNGTAKVTVSVPGAGFLSLSGRGVRRAQKGVGGPGTFTLTLKASGGAKRTLLQSNSAKVRLRVTFSFNGTPGTQSRPVRLKRR